MQNSIWKLTALAGVIGVGFLIVLQAQSGLDKGDKTAEQSQTETNLGEPGAEQNTAAHAPSPWKSQPENTGSTVSQQQPDMRLLSGNSEPNSAEPFEPTNKRRASFASQPEPSEFAADRRPRRAIPVLDQNDTGLSKDPFGNDSNEEPAPAIEKPREKAARLMAEARDLKDAGDLSDARLLLLEAIELPVAYGPLEERPASMLAEIDALLKKKNTTVAKTQTKLDVDEFTPGASLIRRTANEEKKPALQALPDFAPAGLSAEVTEEPFEPGAKKSEPLKEFKPEELPTFGSEEPAELNLDDKAPPKKSAIPTLPTLDSEPSESSEPTPLPFEDEKPAKPALEPAKIKDDIAKPAASRGPKPELAIEKTAPPEAKIGQPMVYSIVVTNKGQANATQVVVEDTVPKGCDLVGTIPQAELSGSKLSWKLGRLVAGDNKKILIKVVPKSEGEIGSIATVNFIAEPLGAAPEATKPNSSQLRLAIFGPEEVRVGETARLKFKISNAGERDLNEVNLQNLIPVGFVHTDGNDLTYPVGRLAAGGSTTVELELKAVRAGEHFNRAILSAAGGLQNESATAIRVVDPRGLRVETTESASMPVGQPTVQEVRLINESSSDINGVTVTEALPEDLRYLKSTGNGTYDEVSRKIRWRLERIPAGETAILKVTVQPKTTGPHTCLIEVNQSGQAKSANAESKVQARGVSSLKLELDHSQTTVLAGDTFTVDVTIRNRGTGPDANVTLALALPPEVEFVQAKSPVRHGPLEAGKGTGKVLTFHAIPELGERASADFQILLRGRAPGKAKIRAEVSSESLGETVSSDTVIVVLDGTP